MSRVAKLPVTVPKGVDVSIAAGSVTVKSGKETLSLALRPGIQVVQDAGTLTVAIDDPARATMALAGTVRSLLDNMVMGVSKGFERKLELVGVGYRAKAQGKSLNLTLGFSHPVEYPVPEGITIETPTQTEIVVKGADKQRVGQVAAEIRAYRPPEPYKGKGVRYSDEQVVRKEAKKK